jgi:hypothetical protein
MRINRLGQLQATVALVAETRGYRGVLESRT